VFRLSLFSCPAAAAAMASAQTARNKAVATASLLLLCRRRHRSGLHKQEQDRPTGGDCMAFYMSRQGLGVQEITNRRCRVVAVAWRGAGRTCGRAARRPRMARAAAAGGARQHTKSRRRLRHHDAPWLRPGAGPGHGGSITSIDCSL